MLFHILLVCLIYNKLINIYVDFQSLYTVHIFPSCDFANENLNRIAPDLMHRVANIAHLLIVIATAIG